MASIIDVAKKAGVSIATVSRVVNNSGYVNQATREKVIESIKALGYVPNELARSMLKKKNQVNCDDCTWTIQSFFLLISLIMSNKSLINMDLKC